MKNMKAFLVAVALMTGAVAQAQGLSDILSGLGNSSQSQNGLGGTISNVLSGIFTKSDLTVADLVGEYESGGPAVTFKSDNFLEKAGGIAGAAAIESKLQPYYEQYGLTGMPLTIDSDGNFTIKVKGIPLSGTVESKDNQGEFIFQIKALGSVKIGQFTAYVTKSGKNLDLMFDAKKLKDLISTVGKLSGMNIATAMTKILDSYEGAYIGFKMQYTGSVSSASSADTPTQATADSVSSGNGQGSGLENLLNIFNNRKK